MQYVDANWKPLRGTGIGEHNYAGNQQVLVGEFFGTWRAWDGIRALDYLVTRDEVDRSIVGITGNSGGGTMTTWLCGLDDRWTMAAPSCFVTELRRNMENELAADTEQMPAARARAGPRSCGLSRGARAEAGHHPGQGEGLLRRARERSRVRAAEAPLPAARRRGQRRATSSGRPTMATRRRTARRCTDGSIAAPASPTPRPSRSW